MSGRTRKLHTNNLIEVIIHDEADMKFAIPRSEAPKILKMLKPFQVDEDDNELVSADKVFADLDKKYGKVGVTIRGLRHRDGMTQVELAKKLDIKQSHVSQMEHGKRVIGKKMAQKLAKIFNTNYRLFL